MGRVGPAHPFLAALARGPLVADAAMGTALLARGARLGDDLAALSIERSDWVEDIHRGHVKAGATVAITNTFVTNTFVTNTFASTPVGTNTFVTNMFVEAVGGARRAGARWVLGSMGPLGPGVGADAGLDLFARKAGALAAAGADAILLETFSSENELALAVHASFVAAPETPCIASVTVSRDLALADGTPLAALAERLAPHVDVFGINCCDGPETVLRALEALRGLPVPIAARPSAGLPERVDGAFVYPVEPAAFGAFARCAFDLGARLVGGCCGATADHVAAIAAAAREVRT